MLRFFVNCFALIGFLVCVAVAGSIYLAFYAQKPETSLPDAMVLSLDFSHSLAEKPGFSPFNFSSGGKELRLFDVLFAIDHAAKDERIKGIVATFGHEQPTLTQAQELRAALARFRDSGKFTYAFGADYGVFGSGNRAYFLASAFENIWLQPVGTVSLTGVAVQSPFIKTALDKIGVVADFMQREEYKSFMEPGMRDSFSPHVKEAMTALVDNIADQIARGIAQSRKWDIDHVKALMARGPYTDEEAYQQGLVTKIAYEDELNDEIDRKAGRSVEHVDVGAYVGALAQKKASGEGATVALIQGQGLVMDEGIEGSDLTGEPILGADIVSQAFLDAADDDRVRAVIFRIDSPGGSPSAAETIRRAIIKAQEKGKPVIVSMAGTAASGGYWIAMNADRIVANPATLTGSIGVVSGKFVLDGLMKKIGVSMDGVSTSPNAGMWSMMAAFTPEQRARLDALLNRTYKIFMTGVAEARNIPMEKMPSIAKGRVFTGEQAVNVGLVDALGGYDVALREVRNTLKISDDVLLSLVEFPAPLSPAERLMNFMKRFSNEAVRILSSLAAVNNVQQTLQRLLSMDNRPVAAQWQSLESVYE
ncbi:MAG: signal peptide peptidase SppA [Alphaproteobacteria bacterium]|nr:signal peptide peptidase SppA [Alphaproteobacteria bacterium]